MLDRAREDNGDSGFIVNAQTTDSRLEAVPPGLASYQQRAAEDDGFLRKSLKHYQTNP